jgi:hypothetical protein
MKLTDLVDALTQVRAATAVANSIGIALPPQLAQFESDAYVALTSVQALTVPTSLDSAITDATHIADALAPLAHTSDFASILAAVQSIPATDQNLKNGQLAVLGIVGASFDGVEDKVVIAAYRASGTFANIVNEGVTDTAKVL